MEKATLAFAALSQPSRVEVIRLLINAGPEGMLAGEIAARLGVRQNTMSANLSVLLRAGLARNAREGRAIRYFADLDGLKAIIGFLMEDCCGGKPELCAAALDTLICDC